jgi:hypothetical protein
MNMDNYPHVTIALFPIHNQ